MIHEFERKLKAVAMTALFLLRFRQIHRRCESLLDLFDLQIQMAHLQ